MERLLRRGARSAPLTSSTESTWMTFAMLASAAARAHLSRSAETTTKRTPDGQQRQDRAPVPRPEVDDDDEASDRGGPLQLRELRVAHPARVLCCGQPFGQGPRAAAQHGHGRPRWPAALGRPLARLGLVHLASKSRDDLVSVARLIRPAVAHEGFAAQGAEAAEELRAAAEELTATPHRLGPAELPHPKRVRPRGGRVPPIGTAPPDVDVVVAELRQVLQPRAHWRAAADATRSPPARRGGA